MPGIVGLITKAPREEAEATLRRMVKALCHEPFYKSGIWVDEPSGVYVGWVLGENSFFDGMPVCNESGNAVLVFAGEEYPAPETVSRLKQRCHSMKEEGPSYLVHLYEEDPNFPGSLNGRFQGLVTNRKQKTATLFNDRYGMRRVYYHEGKGAFYFAAEAKAILAVLPELRNADPYGLGEFVACGCVLENRTLFDRLHVLPPASAWVFRAGAIERRATYFHPREWEEQSPLEPESYYEELREMFSRNLPRYFTGREQIGIALTGGLDTRAIMAWRKSPPGSLPCYTFGGMFRDCQDVRVAQRVASLCRESHEVLHVGSEFLKRFPHYAERSVYLSDGAVDVSRASDLYVSERAREIAPVKLVGTYGSEILCHLVTFKAEAPAPGLFSSDFLRFIQRAHATYANALNEHPVTFAAFRQSPWHHFGVLALEQSQLTVRSPYLDNDFVRTVYRAPKSNHRKNGDVRLRLIADGNRSLGRVPSDRGIGGDTRSVRAAVRRGALEFTFKAEYAYDYGMPQWLARIDHVLSPFHLERLFLGRHKLTHYRVWYRDILSEYVKQILLDPLTLSRPYIDRKKVSAVVAGHMKGNQNYTAEIHKLLALELLHRQFFDHK